MLIFLQEDILGEDILKMSVNEINSRAKLLDNEIKVLTVT